jgi:hypothetical protein
LALRNESREQPAISFQGYCGIRIELCSYVNQSEAGEDLPRWREAERSIAGRPVTLWHGFGHHHIVSAGDLPGSVAVRCCFVGQVRDLLDIRVGGAAFEWIEDSDMAASYS